eukprot:TRINITY_DN75313_c0_g1_i1.p1 TRINITY_DN75313_c0_g1~~TRINITY_DN75313_c0_g1_i1.p1  ORF type:complete len:417 (+),score=172.81 TRINITY_DN75313_c0_g1_i1:89-1252(+)
MTTPDLLTTVGFEKGKIGSGDKEVGYQIKQTSLCSLIGSVLACFAVMGLMVVSMVYDVHFEKKTLHRQIRQEEHHGAAKLAQVQMELWSQYHDDIREAQEAQILLNHLNKAYSEFQGKFHGAVSEFAKELNLEEKRSAKFADKILHLVADMQQSNIKHSKRLLEHLVSAGKKAKPLEKFVDREVVKEVVEEEKRMQEDKADGIDVVAPIAQAAAEGKKGEDLKPEEEDPLKKMLEGFWNTFADYEGEFGGKPRKELADSPSSHGGQVYKQITDLHAKIISETPPSEDEIAEELEKIDLSGIGAGLGSGRVLPVNDIVEEIALIPKIPHQELADLEKEWKSGAKDSMTVFEHLSQLHEKGLVPSGWLQMGVDEEEKEEERMEEKIETE